MQKQFAWFIHLSTFVLNLKAMKKEKHNFDERGTAFEEALVALIYGGLVFATVLLAGLICLFVSL